jgi:hypothetical protein
MMPSITTDTPRRILLVGTAFVALAVAACSGTPAASVAAPASVAPSPSEVASSEPSAAQSSEPSASAGASLATGGRIEFAEQGFAVTLPDGWTRIDLQAQDIDALIEAAGAQNPELAAVYSQQIRAMIAQGLVLFAFGPDPAAGTNVNILATPGMGLSLDFIEQVNVAQLETLTEGTIATERVQLPAGEAIHLTYAMSAGEGMPAPTIDQYMLLAGDKQLVVSVTNASEADAAAIVQSIELLG